MLRIAKRPILPRAGFRPTAAALVLAPCGLAAAFLTAGCGGEAEAPAPELRPVRYITVETANAERVRVLSGTARSSQESRLSFKVTGTVVELPVSVGDQIQSGQLIARLDPIRFELQVERAQADLVDAEAGRRNAEAAYDRAKRLYENQNASKGELDSARAASESAAARVRAAQKQVELARLDLAYTGLRANTDCSIASLGVEVNENVGSGTTVATVSCGSDYEVQMAVPEGLIDEVREGMAATVRFAALEDQTFTGKVTEVGLTASSGATFPATVSIDRPETGTADSETASQNRAGDVRGLRSGLAAEVTLRLPVRNGAVVRVPLAAVVRGSEGDFVYLAEPSGDVAVVQKRAVEIGELTDRGLEVLSGLEPGDRVITAGTSVIFEGLEVRLGARGPAAEPTVGEGDQPGAEAS